MVASIELRLFFSWKFVSTMTVPVKCGVEMKKISGSIPCTKEELNLGVTLKGGQSFRWTMEKNGNNYRGVFNSSVWTISQTNEILTYTMHGSLHKDVKCHHALINYFQLHVPLKEHLKVWSEKDSYFKTSYNEIGTVRMLNQDVVENLFSFICSSNNNILRISGMVEKLCRIFGNKICELEGQDYYDFPTIEALANSKVESVLKMEGFGYRAGYIHKSAEKLVTLGGREWLSSLKKENGSTYDNARENLMSLPGIGPKVADCICLMSLGHLEAIPVDTHIFQVACANYMPHLVPTC
ncbi:N-glycosylase/DNA lyase [Copidosoma floridanum]|uniref:N-glycosylase/DNA lyase n=1 Tax=Copidosoma floridanum TaxID=29053 RepID=UPI0006C9C5F0|nr:N-glycosylase/DNA lyase [Copidosoma floridanum]